jgi:hypothetical protein
VFLLPIYTLGELFGAKILNQLGNGSSHNQFKMITIKEAAKVVADKSDYYDACVRNSYRMPAKKQPIVTTEFLNDVQSKRVWVPKLHEMKLCACPKPPPAKVIRQELLKCIEFNLHKLQQPIYDQFVVLHHHLRTHQADATWMLDLLATCTQGNHPYFAKDYEYVRPKRNQMSIDQVQISNQDNFFDGLPPSKSKRKTTASTFHNLVQGDQVQQIQAQFLRERI